LSSHAVEFSIVLSYGRIFHCSLMWEEFSVVLS
jgi:hypothetical protein